MSGWRRYAIRSATVTDAISSGPVDGAGATLIDGGMAERPNAKLLKSFGVKAPGGSNPPPSALCA